VLININCEKKFYFRRMSITDDAYKFKFIDKKFESISGKENKDLLIKWFVIYFLVTPTFLYLMLLKGYERKIKNINVHF
jgi:hypothetical protein